MDDSRIERRRSIRSLLFGKSGFGRRFESSTENSFREKTEEAEAGLRKCSSHRSNGTGSEDASSQASRVRKSSKSSLVRSLTWIRWNFLGSLSKNSNPSHPSPFKIFGSSLFNREHEISSSYEKIKPCVESGGKIIQQPKSGFAFLEKEVDEMTAKENVQAELCRRAPANYSSSAGDNEDGDIAEHCEDDKLCGEDDVAEHCEDDKLCGEDDVAEEGFFQQRGLIGCPTEDHVWYRKKELKRFPPPLPSLARTGNLPCHMPWVHLRSYKRDGRLVIQEVKVQHHEFFKAERSNGRLILHLVQHDEGKIRAHQAEKFKAEPHLTTTEPSGQDYIDQTEETGAEGVLDEAIDVHQKNNGDKEEMGAEEVADEAIDVLQKDNGDKDIVVAEENIQKFNGNVKGLDKLSPKFSRGKRESKLSDPVQVPVQQRFSPLGLGSPVGCCAPTPNSLFEIPIAAIRPIRS